ncbi:hypothetical protein CC78DRAFT_614326 [Lojkania enalia]|uniref:F-box domain-containing protein n=1 Tax=Lojkania enalia TaxID=147567 RepID=A0A9P4N5K0_9PLEO|nr:hypothetical protein CC78DRAFT_614326 [Didymosphaeria enalia]
MKANLRVVLPGTGLVLLGLADELLLSIITQIDDRKALCNLAATCSYFQDLVEPFIWSKLSIRSGLRALLTAPVFRNRPKRLEYVRELVVRYPEDDEKGIENFDDLLPRMTQLRSLNIESPCPNDSMWRHGAEFRSWTRINYQSAFANSVRCSNPDPVLPMLQSVTLHCHTDDDEGGFSFNETAPIFYHRTLRHITISCTNFDSNGYSWVTQRTTKSSPLQSLKLIECNVYVAFLEKVLRLPKALKELSIGERLHAFNDCKPRPGEPRTQHPYFLDALQHQANSLERLAHIGGMLKYAHSWQLDLEGAAKLRNLRKLRHLDLGFESVLCTYLQQDGCPASLETLRLSDEAWVDDPQVWSNDHTSFIVRHTHEKLINKVDRKINISICFTVGSGASGWPARRLKLAWDDKENPASSAQRRKYVYGAASALKARGAHFQIFGQDFLGGISYIPPYMCGEEEPKEVLWYDSDEFWKLGGRDWQSVDDEKYKNEMFQ